MENKVSGTLNTDGRLMDLSVAKVMGIVNVTPDSFFAQSRTTTADSIRRRAAEMLAQGADILDVGAYSTRPGGEPVSEQQEMDRLGSALQAVRSECGDVCLSVDTFRPEVARMVVGEFGVGIINDVTGGNRNGVFGAEQLADDTDDDVPAMFRAVAEMGVAPSSMPSDRKTFCSTRASVSARPWSRTCGCSASWRSATCSDCRCSWGCRESRCSGKSCRLLPRRHSMPPP